MPTTVVSAAILIMGGIGAAPRASGAQATPSTKPSATAFDACALVTKQEAATAIGEAVGKPTPIGAGRPAMPGVNTGACEYQAATAPATVQVYVWRFSNDSTGQFLRQRYEKGCANKERLSGLGDVACWYTSEHRELQVLKGTSFLIIRIIWLKRDGNATEVLTTVAKKALARLP